MDFKDIKDPPPSGEYDRFAEEHWKQERERLRKDIAQSTELLNQHLHAVTEKDAQLARIELKLDEVLELLGRER